MKHECVQSCDPIRFEYNNVCYENCSDNNSYLFINQIIKCSAEIPENFYLDSNKIYKECYQSCKKCSQNGSEEINNCDECKDNFTFLNETFIEKKNCFPICNYYYFFDENNHYICTLNNSCPDNFKKFIDKNRCIDDCNKNDHYIYEFNNTCLEKCPNGTKNDSTNRCYEEKYYEKSIFTSLQRESNIIYDTSILTTKEKIQETFINKTEDKKILNEDKLLLTLQEDIINGRLDDIIKNVTESKKDYTIKKDNIIYQITTSDNQKIKTNYEISNINLLECENILKEKYNINKTLSLIILKIDYKLNYTLIPIVGYEVYHPENKSKLDLSFCNDTIIVNVPALVDENKLFRNDPNSDFYYDNCFSYTTENGTDIILNDRKQEFIDNNLSLCEINCSYIEYNKDTKQSSCDCYIKNKMDLISEIISNPNKLSNNINENQSDSGPLNIKTMKCTKELFSKDGLKSNISSYILLIIIFIFLLSIILFIKCGYHLLEEEIKSIIILIEKSEKNQPNIIKNNINNNSKKKGRIKKINIHYPPKKSFNLSLINNNIKMKKGKNSKNNLNQKNKQKSSVLKTFIEQKTKKKAKKKKWKQNNPVNKGNATGNKYIKLEFNIFELNSLSYNKAIIYDKRTCCEYYISLLKIKHPIIFSFCPIKDYNTMIIKICISSLSFAIYYTINFIFFDEKAIHKIYEDKGKYDIIYFIPKITISFVISHFIYVIVKYIFLSERNLLQIRQQITASLANEIASKEKRNLIIKYSIFFILGIIFLGFFWMFLSSFGAVYQNSQIIVFENTLICLAMSLIYPFFINIFPCIFRIPPLNSETKDQQCIYNFSKCLQIL